jgi:hypothetical protein
MTVPNWKTPDVGFARYDGARNSASSSVLIRKPTGSPSRQRGGNELRGTGEGVSRIRLETARDEDETADDHCSDDFSEISDLS